MIISIILAILIGIIAGTFTGLIPGIHTNLIAIILVSSLALFSNTPVFVLAVFICSMATTHTFISFVPAVFLGAPDEENFLSILPGHKMLLEGRAHEAVVISLYGSLFALGVIIFLTPIFLIFSEKIFSKIIKLIPFILLFVSTYSIFREKNSLLSLLIFSLSGFLGFFSLNLSVNQPLLPLLSGLFGVSSLIISTKQKNKIPEQKISKLKEIKLTKKEIFAGGIGSIFSAPFCSFLPGLGSGHAGLIGSEIKKQTEKSFIFLVGAINTIVLGISFTTLYTLQKTRTGSASAIKEMLGQIATQDLFLFILISLFSGIISFFLGIYISRIAAKKISKINYKKTSILIIFFLAILTFIVSGFFGLIILTTATTLGIFTILSNSRRINLMGSLIIPTILFYI